MSPYIILFALFLCALSGSLLITKTLIAKMAAFGVVDKPSARRVHKEIIPRGAGLGFVLILSILMPIFEYFTFNTIHNSERILQIFLPIALVSFWDDINGVVVLIRLIVHILCSILAIMWIIHPDRLLHYEISPTLDLAIGAFALLTFVNIYNFLDGIDGISASESIHLSSTILILCYLRASFIPEVELIASLATITLGWSLGFIFFNWQPAKIFLGDVGSIGLGFILGMCLLKVATSGERLFAACVIASLYYIADGGMTILIRIIKKEKIWQPHLQHFFQKAVKRGQTHKQVVMRIMKCNFLLMILAVNCLYYPIISIILAMLVVMVTLIKSVIT